jgi:hypothetical protein
MSPLSVEIQIIYGFRSSLIQSAHPAHLILTILVKEKQFRLCAILSFQKIYFFSDGVHFSCTLVLTLLTRLLCINNGARHYVCEDMKIFNVYVYLSRMVCAVLSLYSLSWVVAVVRR